MKRFIDRVKFIWNPSTLIHKLVLFIYLEDRKRVCTLFHHGAKLLKLPDLPP